MESSICKAKACDELETDGLYKIINALILLTDVCAREFLIETLIVIEFNVNGHCVNFDQAWWINILKINLSSISGFNGSVEVDGIASVNIIIVFTPIGYHCLAVDSIGLIVLQDL